MTSGARRCVEDLLVDHNTAIPGGHSAYLRGVTDTAPAMSRFRLTNNLDRLRRLRREFPAAEPVATRVPPEATIARNALVSMADTGMGKARRATGPPRSTRRCIPPSRTAAAAGLNDGWNARGRRARTGGQVPTARISASTSMSSNGSVRISFCGSEVAVQQVARNRITRCPPSCAVRSASIRQPRCSRRARGSSPARTVVSRNPTQNRSPVMSLG